MGAIGHFQASVLSDQGITAAAGYPKWLQARTGAFHRGSKIRIQPPADVVWRRRHVATVVQDFETTSTIRAV